MVNVKINTIMRSIILCDNNFHKITHIHKSLESQLWMYYEKLLLKITYALTA